MSPAFALKKEKKKSFSKERAAFQEGKNASEKPPCFTSRPPLFVFPCLSAIKDGDGKFDSVSGKWRLSKTGAAESKKNGFISISLSVLKQCGD